MIVTFSKPVDTHETTDWIYSLLDWYWYVHHAVHAPQPVSYTDYNRLSCSRIQLVYFVRLIPQNLRTKSAPLFFNKKKKMSARRFTVTDTTTPFTLHNANTTTLFLLFRNEGMKYIHTFSLYRHSLSPEPISNLISKSYCFFYESG